jgi:hypothetical protein
VKIVAKGVAIRFWWAGAGVRIIGALSEAATVCTSAHSHSHPKRSLDGYTEK